MPRAGAAAASSKNTAHSGSGVPAPLANLAPPRRGETDRNTEQTKPTPVVPQGTDHFEEPMHDLNYEL
jgi:hypothetical protein